MRKSVETGTGSIYNPYLNRPMTQEEAKEHIKIVENDMSNQSMQLPTTDMLANAQNEITYKKVNIAGSTNNSNDKEATKNSDGNQKSNATTATILSAITLPIGVYAVAQFVIKRFRN